MKKWFYVFGFILLLIVSCTSTDDSQNSDEQNLNVLLTAITDLASQSVCGTEFTCKFIALGEKACGGPKSYLVYSTSIDINELEAMVVGYNASEKEFNIKWNVVSDCSFLLPPDSVICENGKCKAVYE